MLEKEMEIIDQSMQLFMKLGIKSVTMDEVSRQLGISKKTLYNYVADKNDLVNKVLTFSCDRDNDAMSEICAKGMNAIDESFEMSNFVFKHINTLHPSIMFDLQKYHSNAWDNFKKMKRGKIKSVMPQIFQKE